MKLAESSKSENTILRNYVTVELNESDVLDKNVDFQITGISLSEAIF